MQNLNGLVCIWTPKIMLCLTRWNLGLLLRLGNFFGVYVLILAYLLHTCLLFVFSYLQAYFIVLSNFMLAPISMHMELPGCAQADPTRTLLKLTCILCLLDGSCGIEMVWPPEFCAKIFHTFYLFNMSASQLDITGLKLYETSTTK